MTKSMQGAGRPDGSGNPLLSRPFPMSPPDGFPVERPVEPMSLGGEALTTNG